MKKAHVYIVHSVVPSYFSSAYRALARAWATSAPYAERGDPQSKARYVAEGIKTLRAKGIIKPIDSLSPFPKITMEELQ